MTIARKPVTLLFSVRQDKITAERVVIHRNSELTIFSRKSDYGLRALIYLGERRESGPVTLSAIATRLNIPKAFLSKILQQLTRSNIVHSTKGPAGGFILCQDPRQLTIRRIIEEIEGARTLFECHADSKNCRYFGNCRILDMLGKVRTEMDRVLDNYVLADFLETAVPTAKPPESLVPAN